MMVDINLINSTLSKAKQYGSFDILGQNFAQNVFSLVAYTLAVVVYAVIIWNFYRKLAKRDIFNLDIKRHQSFREGLLKRIWDFFEFLFKYIVLFPFISFMFFAVLSAFLIFLSKSQTVQQILLISMTIVASSRIASYYNEDLAKDLAKMIPFTLLGVFIVDPSFFSMEEVIARFYQLPSLMVIILQYIAFVVILEFVLVVVDRIYMAIFKKPITDEV